MRKGNGFNPQFNNTLIKKEKMEDVYFKTTLNELVKLQKDTDVVISKREKEIGSPLYCEGKSYMDDNHDLQCLNTDHEDILNNLNQTVYGGLCGWFTRPTEKYDGIYRLIVNLRGDKQTVPVLMDVPERSFNNLKREHSTEKEWSKPVEFNS